MDKQINTYQKNDIVFKEGVYERCMYDIVSGSVSIYANYGSRDEKLLVTLEVGQYFGEIGISDMVPRTATAIAASDDTRLAVITLENFYDYFSSNTGMVLNIMRNMSARLRALTADYMEACRTIAEASDSAKKGRAGSDSLKNRLSKLVNSFLKPVFSAQDASPGYVDNVIAQSAECYAIRTFKKNEVIFREGDFSPRMYNVNWGRVGIYADYGKPTQKLLAELKSEESFGEMGLIDNAPRSATAVALDNDTELQMISEAGFADFMKDKPAMVISMMQQLSHRLKELSRDYMEVCGIAAKAAEASRENREKTYWESVSADSYNEIYDQTLDLWDPEKVGSGAWRIF